jgi:predicted phage tail protein
MANIKACKSANHMWFAGIFLFLAVKQRVTNFAFTDNMNQSLVFRSTHFFSLNLNSLGVIP